MRKIIRKAFYGPSNYSVGGVYERIDPVLDVEAVFNLNTGSGYLAELSGITGNAIKYKVYWQTGSSGQAFTEIADGTDISTATFEATIMGE